MHTLFKENFWASPQDMVELARKDIEKGHVQIQDLQGKWVSVEVYIQDGKLRAYCEGCQSDDCIHTYFAIDVAIRRILHRALEIEIMNPSMAMKKYRRLTLNEKIEILEKLGIDTADLKDYLNRIGRKNAREITIWKEMIGLRRRVLY